MAKIHDLLEKISDPALKEALVSEVAKLSKQKKFGLVFEEHLPEACPMPGVKIRVGMTVATRAQDGGSLFRVKSIEGKKAICVDEKTEIKAELPLEELVAVTKFGEPIYPYLEKIDELEHGGGDLWHTLIQADNYHALQLLEYLYPGQVDCIYIDPPYNTGAKDWKYNNDYVDGNDAWRHSKWLSMMEKRLKIAKRLLNPRDSVLIVTIDEKEYLHLGMLLEQMFPEARIQMVSSVINPAVVARVEGFGRCAEYIYFVMFGNSIPDRLRLEREWVSSKGRTHTGQIRWDLLKRSGTGALRKDSPGGFYPIYINSCSGKIEFVGEALLEGDSIAPERSGCVPLLPIRDDGSEGRWQWTADTIRERMKYGRVKIGGNSKRGFTVYILKDGEFSKIHEGEFVEIGRGVNNELLVSDVATEHVLAVPGELWRISSHDATQYGSRLITNILVEKRFTFPKSLYAVHDAIRFFVANKPNALILDFFAGSGTTLHAVNLLNAEDGGKRRCILVTNNEVSNDEAKAFREQGLKPGDVEWEAKGIARYVTWPRTTCSIKGVNVKGEPLKGDYLSAKGGALGDRALPMSEGFKANAAFFKLGFLEPSPVALGRKFEEMLPLLWLKAGAHGACPSVKRLEGMLVLPENKMAVLADEWELSAFKKQVKAAKTIETIYLVTDYEPSFRSMAKAFPGKTVIALYRDYLDHFRINISRN